MSRESVYRLRRRAGAQSFTAAWDSVLARKGGGATAIALLCHRAFNGIVKPVVRDGQPVAWLHRPDNKIALALFDRMARSDRSRARIATSLQRRSPQK